MQSSPKVQTMSLAEFNTQFNKGNKYSRVEFSGVNTVTVYNIETVAQSKYCRDHSGFLVDKNGMFHPEDCDCE